MKTRNYDEIKKKEVKYINYILPILSKNTNFSIYLPTNQFTHYDAIVTTDKTVNHIEYKIRDKEYDETMLEVVKYQNLMQYSKPYYIITDNIATYIFNLKRIDFNKLKIVEIKSPKTTVSNVNFYYDAQYVTKQCYMLPKSLAVYVLPIKNNDL